MRRFVVIGQTATASPDFLLDDLPGSSGRLDVLLRCVRAALLVSHGLRRDCIVYLLLGGGPQAPRVLRVDGRQAKFLRPDERSLARLAQKVLASAPRAPSERFLEIRPGVSLLDGGLRRVFADLGEAKCYLLDAQAPDLRGRIAAGEVAFFLGDHSGVDVATAAELEAHGVERVSVGPVSLHADDVIAVVSNELDRRDAAR